MRAFTAAQQKMHQNAIPDLVTKCWIDWCVRDLFKAFIAFVVVQIDLFWVKHIFTGLTFNGCSLLPFTDNEIAFSICIVCRRRCVMLQCMKHTSSDIRNMQVTWVSCWNAHTSWDVLGVCVCMCVFVLSRSGAFCILVWSICFVCMYVCMLFVRANNLIKTHKTGLSTFFSSFRAVSNISLRYVMEGWIIQYFSRQSKLCRQIALLSTICELRLRSRALRCLFTFQYAIYSW